MPVDGDDGFYPTTGNELVGSSLCFVFLQFKKIIVQLHYYLQKPEVVNSSRKYRVRVLVCAPSNSALDEIVLRVLNNGISPFFPYLQDLVRVVC